MVAEPSKRTRPDPLGEVGDNEERGDAVPEGTQGAVAATQPPQPDGPTTATSSVSWSARQRSMEMRRDGSRGSASLSPG